MTIQERVYAFPTKYKEGLTVEEVEMLLREFPYLHREKYDFAIMGVTGTIVEDQFIYYRGDILKAIRCGMENRELTQEEWD